MQGIKNTMIGILACVLGGTVIMGAAYMNFEHPWISYGGYGLIGVGGILFVLGLLHMCIHNFQAQKGLHQEDASAMAMALIRSMIAMSIADGTLDDSELKTISKIYTQLTGSQIDEETIRETAEYMKQEGVQITDEMERIKPILDKNLRNKIIKAALYILAADGVMDKGEEAILEEIRAGLGIPKGKLKEVKEKFLAERGIQAGP